MMPAAETPVRVSSAYIGRSFPGRRAVALAIVVLALVVIDIRLSGPVDHLDHHISAHMYRWNLRHRTWPRRVLTVGLYFGQRGVVLTGAILVATWLSWRARTVEPILRLIVALVGLVAVVYAFKIGLARNAPIQDTRGVSAGHGASFPSGHMANAVLLWGLADWSARRWAAPKGLRRALRGGRTLAPIVIPVVMTLLNYHWLSDMIGGAAVGVILLALTLQPWWGHVALRIDRRWGRAPSPSG